ncbi:MAG: NAD(+) diphosphatase [Firmicutes bacterium]|nr:NAD(+) diphosphatase [Bacillota bacterium]
MIQDILPRVMHNRYEPDKKAGPASTVLCYENGGFALLPDGDGLRFPTFKDLFGTDGQAEGLIYLFSIDSQEFFLAPQGTQVPDGSVRMTVRELRSSRKTGKYLVFAGYTAMQLANWYRDNRFCGRCGQETALADNERAIVCPHCGRRIYPRVVPAVIVGVTNGDKLLITRYAHRPVTHDALVAGFTEIGETLEETVQREVEEEVGLKVKNIRYYKSQPWGIVDDLLMGFYCDVDGDDTIRLDDGELAVGRWVERADIEGQPDNLSLTNEMMVVFREGKEPKKAPMTEVRSD